MVFKNWSELISIMPYRNIGNPEANMQKFITPCNHNKIIFSKPNFYLDNIYIVLYCI